MSEITRADKAHGLAQRAYCAAMRELQKADDLGIMLAACAKCGNFLLGEVAAVEILHSGEIEGSWVVERPIEDLPERRAALRDECAEAAGTPVRGWSTGCPERCPAPGARMPFHAARAANSPPIALRWKLKC